jgi:prepilin-type N-terminal cleavage/methylation domain-containing protein
MRKRQPTQSGFTLVELMVSLVAGLIIAMSVVGLAQQATKTFHEEVRAGAAEGHLRSAIERLRLDLVRAGYMSTGNIKLDPKIARRAGVATGSRYLQLNNMSSIRLFQNGSAAATNADNLATNNILSPDTIWLTGNFTSTDEYEGVYLKTGGNCGGPRMLLGQTPPLLENDATVYQLVKGGATGVKRTFMPADGHEFVARITDRVGCFHYAPVCDAGLIAGQAFVDFKADSNGHAGVPSGAIDGRSCGVPDGNGSVERLFVAPIQTVQWSIQRRPDPDLDPIAGLEPATHKFDLVRQFVDSNGTLVDRLLNASDPEPERVAEWAVDLKFGFTVDQALSAAAVGTTGLILSFDPDSATNATWAGLVGTQNIGDPGPQRIRAVRFRVAVRSPMADRQADVTPDIVPGFAGTYRYRYCVDNVALASCTRFARVRTVMSEVSLRNQGRMYY